MAKVLTAAAVERYREAKGRREIADGGARGLYLVVQPTGAKSWCMRLRRPNGRTAKLHLGPCDVSGKEAASEPVIGAPLTLAAARAVAAEVHRQRAMGRDVVADHLAAKRRRASEIQESASNTFGALAPRFVVEHARKRTRRWRETARLLGLRPEGDELKVIRGGLCERWRDTPVTGLDGGDVWALLDEVRKSGAPGLKRRAEKPTDSRARAMLSALSTFFTWCARHRLVAENPCIGVHRPPAPKARDRVLTGAEISAFWRACDAAGEPFGQALKLLLLTGCRLSEVADMRRAELSDDGKTWTIPGTRSKNGRPHVVSLPPLAREIIDSVRTIEGGHVFTTTGKTPISGWSKVKRRLDEKMGNPPPWRLHDLRRTAATGMAELGVPPHIVEAALNHVSGAKAGVAGTYNRAAYAEEKRAALERWGAHIAGLVSGKAANVVPMRKKGRAK